MSTLLPIPEPSRRGALAFVGEHLDGLFSGPLTGSERYRGGQEAADAALEAFDVAGYARRRNEVWPTPLRGASGLSPYIRHGLLSLAEVWESVGAGPIADVAKFRDELLWQEYARHWYARLGTATRRSVRHELTRTEPGSGSWDRSMACLETMVDELEDDGWLVNQARMWLASHWTVRTGGVWQDGEEEFFRHLLDGSRAANRLGWQWTTGAGSSKAYGFSRWQVEKRAPGLCGQCERSAACPIEDWPDDPVLMKKEPEPQVRRSVDPTADAGPASVRRSAEPSLVWLTAESLGTGDPALAANPERAVVFVFDEPLLAGLRLAAKRLVFLVETLAELAQHRDLRLYRGVPTAVLSDTPVAVTFAPVPGFRRISPQLEIAELHPYRWLHRPSGGTVSSFTSWQRSIDR